MAVVEFQPVRGWFMEQSHVTKQITIHERPWISAARKSFTFCVPFCCRSFGAFKRWGSLDKKGKQNKIILMSRPEFGPRSSRCYGRSWSNNGRGAWSYLDWPDCDFLPNRILSSLWRRASRGTPARWNRAHQRLGAAAGKTELGWPRLRGTNHSYPTYIIALLLRTEISVLDENEEEWD